MPVIDSSGNKITKSRTTTSKVEFDQNLPTEHKLRDLNPNIPDEFDITIQQVKISDIKSDEGLEKFENVVENGPDGSIIIPSLQSRKSGEDMIREFGLQFDADGYFVPITLPDDSLSKLYLGYNKDDAFFRLIGLMNGNYMDEIDKYSHFLSSTSTSNMDIAETGAYKFNSLTRVMENLPIRGFWVKKQFARTTLDEIDIFKHKLSNKIDEVKKNNDPNLDVLIKAKEKLDEISRRFDRDPVDSMVDTVHEQILKRRRTLESKIDGGFSDTMTKKRQTELTDIMVDPNIDLDPNDYFFKQVPNFKDKGDKSDLLIARDYSHLLIPTSTGEFKKIPITLDNGELNQDIFFFVDQPKINYPRYSSERADLLAEANGRLLIFPNTQLKGNSPMTRILDAHYINKLNTNLERFIQGDHDQFYQDLSDEALRNLEIAEYNDYIDEISGVSEDIIVDGEPMNLCTFILKERNELITELLTRKNPVDKMVAHGLIFNNVVAFRSRQALDDKFNKYIQPFESNLIYHDIDTRIPGSDNYRLDSIVRKPSIVTTRDMSGDESFISRISSESYLGNNYMKSKSDNLAEFAISDDLINRIHSIYGGPTWIHSWELMLRDLTDAYSAFKGTGSGKWTRIVDGKDLDAGNIRGIVGTGDGDIDYFFQKSIRTLRQAIWGTADVKLRNSPRFLVFLALEYLGIR